MKQRTHEDFDEIRKSANGMLAPHVYAEIHKRSLNSPNACIVEVGTAHGAATICLALGSRDAGKQETVYTFDMIVGGSRDAYGGLEENLKYIGDHFQKHGVADSIKLTVGKMQDTFGTVEHQIKATGIGCLMLDADGSIDRDFILLYNQILPGAPIIIDDSEATTRLYRKDDSTITVDLKHQLTRALITCFENAGLIEHEETHDVTYFGRKPESVASPFDFELLRQEIAQAYRSVIFSEAEVPYPWSRLQHLEAEVEQQKKHVQDYRNSMSYRLGNATVRAVTFRWFRR